MHLIWSQATLNHQALFGFHFCSRAFNRFATPMWLKVSSIQLTVVGRKESLCLIVCREIAFKCNHIISIYIDWNIPRILSPFGLTAANNCWQWQWHRTIGYNLQLVQKAHKQTKKLNCYLKRIKRCAIRFIFWLSLVLASNSTICHKRKWEYYVRYVKQIRERFLSSCK